MPEDHFQCLRRAVLKLMFDAMVTAAERWRVIKVTEFEPRQMAAIKVELDQKKGVQIGLKPQTSKARVPDIMSSGSRI